MSDQITNLKHKRALIAEEVAASAVSLNVLINKLDKHKSPALLEIESSIENSRQWIEAKREDLADIDEAIEAEMAEIELHRLANAAQQGVEDDE